MIAVSNLLKGESIFFRYSVNVGENSFDLKQVAIISAETCQMVLNLVLASICIEKNWGDERILVIPVTWQISTQPLNPSQPIPYLTALLHYNQLSDHLSDLSLKPDSVALRKTSS